ncbi:universal stress protein [Alsobacter soli]|uniref:Universal stress protein n=1 Tax=Alsobacter soli TaxID=2109933 RepID=A0A2T1HUQ8_9HYPH|nr:universal stress protein [Alsobacter soli]PSC05396.1 universal stress protein [Alsobacter soli]
MRDLLVQMDGGQDDEARLGLAQALACGQEAHVTGLLLNPLPSAPEMPGFDAGVAAGELIAGMFKEAHRLGNEAQEQVRRRLARWSASYELRRYDGYSLDLAAHAAREARWKDIFVAPLPSGERRQWRETVIAALFGSGRSVLLAPAGARAPASFGTVVIAWRDTRESARAVEQALPILVSANRTALVVVEEPLARGARRTTEPEADAVRYLARHGAKLDVIFASSQNGDVGAILRDQCARLSADLLVMGGYGHSRLREWVLGGVTEDMLDASPTPVLMAH